MTQTPDGYVTLANDNLPPEQTITVRLPLTGLSPAYARAGWHEIKTATTNGKSARSRKPSVRTSRAKEPTPDAGATPA